MTNNTKVDFQDENSIAENSGLIHRAFYEGIRRFVASDMSERAAQRDKALSRLVEAGMMAEEEASELRAVCDTLRQTTNGKAERVAAVQSVSERLRRSTSSNTAKTIAGVALDSVTNEIPDAVGGRVAHADVEGAIVGGIFGLELGGGYGALGGVLLGGAASSIAEAV